MLSELELQILKASVTFIPPSTPPSYEVTIHYDYFIMIYEEMISNIDFERYEICVAMKHLFDWEYVNHNGLITNLGKQAIKDYPKEKKEFVIKNRLPIWFSSVAIGISFISLIYNIFFR